MEGAMAWFLNHYICARCGSDWTDEWSCCCDDDCPHCGARHMSPVSSDDLSEIVEGENGSFVVYRSPETAGHYPDYIQVAEFPDFQQAEAFVEANRPAD